MNKNKEYKALVSRIKECSKLEKQAGSTIPTNAYCNTNDAKVKLCHFPEENFEEVNLWTYWQGKGNLNANILLVGQDWGQYYPEEPTIRNIRKQEFYLTGDESKTDQNLIELFKVLGYRIGTDNQDENLKDLFFTNLVACYRTKGLTGNFRQRWITNCMPYTKELIRILEPRIIICLGRRTYEGVCSIYGKKASGNISYNDTLDAFEAGKTWPVALTDQYEDKERGMIIPSAHPGALGCNNRKNSNHGKTVSGMDSLIADWKAIGKYIEQMKKENKWKE